jgi:hypothetical protein
MRAWRIQREDIGVIKAPRFKLQAPENRQASNGKWIQEAGFEICSLEIPWSLDLGA